jgi:iron complex transport system ATP-binding protein
VQFKNLQAAYQGQIVFENINAQLPSGQITTLLGLNGSGKTTLMLLLAGLKPMTAGEITVGTEKAFYLPQKNQVFDFLTVAELLAINRNNDESQLQKLIELFGLAPLLKRDISLLSGGQQQRAWIVYTLLQPAKILLLDEPLTYLDLKYQQKFLEALIWQRQLGRTILLSLHDINFAARCSQNIWFLTPQQLVTGKKAAVLTKQNLINYLELSPEYAQLLISDVRGRNI